MNTVEPIRDKRKLEKMKKFLKDKSLRDYTLFVTGINSGLRISDLLSLKLADVYEAGAVKSRVTVKEQKTGKTRDFPLSDTARKALYEYILQLPLSKQPEDFLFRSRKGGSLTRTQAYRIINHAAHIAGIDERIGTHTLRKTFGYHAYQQCQDLSLIMKILNHSSEAVTLRYIGITKEDCDKVYMNLNL